MTITYLGEIPDDRSAQNNKGIRTYSRAFRLKTSLASEGAYAVGSHASVPLIGATHPEDPLAWCISLDVKNSDPWKGWTVTAGYDSTIEMNTNPEFDPASIEWDNENFEEALVYDINGDAVLNAANDPFENAVRERSRRVVTVTVSVVAVPTWIITAEDAVNSAAFTLDGKVIPTGQAKLSAPRLGLWQYRNGTRFRKMTMLIKLNKDGWNYQPLNAGYFQILPGGDHVRCRAKDGTDVVHPVPLSAVGLQLASPTPATATYGDFDIYPALDFNTLPLT